jgi:hypothetical protein
MANNYNPAGEPVYLVAKYEKPKPPAEKEVPWVFLIIVFALSMTALGELDVGVIAKERCFGSVCIRVDIRAAEL